MTELQLGLIGLGASAVVGVLAYNKWQEARHRKLAESVMKTQHDDVLMGNKAPVERSEPGLNGPAGEAAAPGAVAAQPQAPVLAEEETVFAAVPQEELVAGVPTALLDPQTEFIVLMELVEPIAAAQILEYQATALERLNKTVFWVGFNERTREWEYLDATGEQVCRRLRVGLQLANRSGPVSDVDLSIFVGAMQALADHLMAVADMPSRPVLEEAAQLDQFCADVDLEIGVNLLARAAPFTGTKIRALAEAAGMVLGEDGVFTRYDEDGCTQFSLQNFESTLFTPDAMKTLATHGLTFLLDVPRVQQGERVFQQMVELARRFGETLQGTLVDDNRQPLGEAQLEHIKREFVMKPRAIMAERGIPAGSPQALRLFS